MKQHNYYVYIMSSISRVLYTGVTGDLIKRVEEHKMEVREGFTERYKCNKLVYYEYFGNINDAINREKQVKGLLRIKKINLIEQENQQINLSIFILDNQKKNITGKIIAKFGNDSEYIPLFLEITENKSKVTLPGINSTGSLSCKNIGKIWAHRYPGQ